MSDTLTIRGFIATTPTQKYLPGSQIPVTNFRLASTARWFDPKAGAWKEGETNWYTINCFRALAHNSARSLQVGQPILVTGRLRVKEFERQDGSSSKSVEIDATALGQDLAYGLSSFTRVTEGQPQGQNQAQMQGHPESPTQDQQQVESQTVPEVQGSGVELTEKPAPLAA